MKTVPGIKHRCGGIEDPPRESREDFTDAFEPDSSVGINPVIRLLIVDDHSVVRCGLANWIRSQIGLELIGEAASAEEALELTIVHRPDLVLLDIGLPGASGLAAMQRITQVSHGTKVIAFSATADHVIVRGMLAAGAKGYLLKTSDPSTIISAIKSVIAGSYFLDPGLSRSLIEELKLGPLTQGRAPEVLSSRQMQVLEQVGWGYSDKQIAAKLGISVNTVHSHRVRACEKLGLTDRAELVRFVMAVGLMDPQRKRCPKLVSIHSDFRARPEVA